MDRIPRHIHSIWFQGIDQAPAWVQSNFERTRILNPEYRFTVHGKQSVMELIGDCGFEVPDDITPQALSDIFRIAVLRQHGGVWMDASLFLCKPLWRWLEPRCANSDFFAYSYPGDWRLPLSSWFLSAHRDSAIISVWYDFCLTYWTENKRAASPLQNSGVLEGDPFEFMKLDQAVSSNTYPYFWFHHIFGYLLKTNQAFADAWAVVDTLPSKEAHALQNALRKRQRRKKRLRVKLSHMLRPRHHRAVDAELVAHSPAQKLDWRMEIDTAYWSALADAQL